jgi:hypothetical protein
MEFFFFGHPLFESREMDEAQRFQNPAKAMPKLLATIKPPLKEVSMAPFRQELVARAHEQRPIINSVLPVIRQAGDFMIHVYHLFSIHRVKVGQAATSGIGIAINAGLPAFVEALRNDAGARTTNLDDEPRAVTSAGGVQPG